MEKYGIGSNIKEIRGGKTVNVNKRKHLYLFSLWFTRKSWYLSCAWSKLTNYV